MRIRPDFQKICRLKCVFSTAYASILFPLYRTPLYLGGRGVGANIKLRARFVDVNYPLFFYTHTKYSWQRVLAHVCLYIHFIQSTLPCGSTPIQFDPSKLNIRLINEATAASIFPCHIRNALAPHTKRMEEFQGYKLHKINWLYGKKAYKNYT